MQAKCDSDPDLFRLESDMDFEIHEHEGAGPIRFEMTIAEVRRILSVPVSSFMKTATSAVPTDAFDSLGMHVHYASSGVCHAIEMATPARATFRGQKLIGRSFGELRQLFESWDNRVTIDETGLTSFSLGIGLYAPSAAKAPHSPVEGVIVFAKDYYDEPSRV